MNFQIPKKWAKTTRQQRIANKERLAKFTGVSRRLKILNKRDETHLIWSLLSTESATIKKESNGVHFHRLAIAVCSHELAQLGASFNPKEHLVTVLSNKTQRHYKADNG